MIILGNKIQKANSRLEIEELSMMAEHAFRNNYLAGQVEWLKEALARAVEEKNANIENYR